MTAQVSGEGKVNEYPTTDLIVTSVVHVAPSVVAYGVSFFRTAIAAVDTEVAKYFVPLRESDTCSIPSGSVGEIIPKTGESLQKAHSAGRVLVASVAETT